MRCILLGLFIIFVTCLFLRSNVFPPCCPIFAGSTSVPSSLFLNKCQMYQRRHTSTINFNKFQNSFKLALILLLSGDISLNPGPGFKFGLSNVRSLRNKHVGFSKAVLEAGFNLVSLTETWLSQSDTASFLSEITPTGFKLHHIPRTHRRGGGVGFMVNESFDFIVLQSPSFGFESIIAQLKQDNTCLNFATVYQPPAMSFSYFMEELTKFMEYIQSLPSPTIISGDFNIHVDKDGFQSQKLHELLCDVNMSQIINFPTHLHGHTLDLIITCDSFKNNIKNVQTVDCFCDHFLISANIDLSINIPSVTNEIFIRKYHNIDMDKLRYDLKNSDLINNPSTDVKSLCSQYHSTLSNLLNKHAPLVKKTLRPSPSPWFKKTS